MLPSVWAFMREPQRDMEIGGYYFPKGTNIFISPLMLGMDERNHPEAEKFKPERWTREYEKGLPRGSHVNFAAGPRVCMGKTFATIEMQMILATLAQNVEFEVPEGLSEEEEQVYRDQLAMFIIPMEERALEAFEGGYQRAIELGIFNRWTARLRESLTRLNDVQYPPLREAGGDIVEGAPLPMPEPLMGLSRGEDEEDDEGDEGDGEGES